MYYIVILYSWLLYYIWVYGILWYLFVYLWPCLGYSQIYMTNNIKCPYLGGIHDSCRDRVLNRGQLA